MAVHEGFDDSPQATRVQQREWVERVVAKAESDGSREEKRGEGKMWGKLVERDCNKVLGAM